MITKWRLNTRAVIRDGNLGRGADTLQGKDVILEVFSKGTAATGWEEVESRHTDEEGVSNTTVLFSLALLYCSDVVAVLYRNCRESTSPSAMRRERPSGWTAWSSVSLSPAR
jgi:hypothetical protein